MTIQSYTGTMTKQAKTRGLRRTPSRAALLGAAEMLMGENGLASVSIDEIVARAGVAKGTFYNHFDSKADLARALAIAIRSNVRDRIATAKAHSQDPAVHMAIAQASFVTLAVEQPQRAALLLRLLSGSTWPSSPINRNLEATLQEGVRLGRFAVTSIAAGVAFAIGTAVASMRATLDRGSSRDRRTDLVQPLLVHFLVGLGLDASEARQISAAALQSTPE